MQDFKNYHYATDKALYIHTHAVANENEPAGNLSGPFKVPYHIFGFVTSGSGTIQRTDNIFKFRTVFSEKNIKMYIQRLDRREIEIYNTEKDISFVSKKEKVPTHNGTVGIYSHDMSICIKSFKITLNGKCAAVPGIKHNVEYACPAIPADTNKVYSFKDFNFKFSQKSKAVNGGLIKWTADSEDIILKDGTFEVKAKGVYTLFGKYQNRIKKFFIVTQKDKQNQFILFSFKFKDWAKPNNPFTVEQFFDRLPIKNISLIQNGPFKDFLHIKNGAIPFVIKLNSDTVKHFSDYTLSCEIFTDDANIIDYKRMGFIARLNQKGRPISKSDFCAVTYTQVPGAIITVSNYKMLNPPTAHTCNDCDLTEIQTLPKNDSKSNDIIYADTDLCFYLPKDSEYFFKANSGSVWKYSWIGFDTNIEISDFAYKKFFTLPEAQKIFTKVQTTTDEKELFDIINYLLTVLHSYPNSTQSATLSISQKVKELVQKSSCASLTVKNIANHLNLSSNYLSTVFKKETGQTLQQYITNFKLNKSKSLLLVEGLSVTRVGEMLGYENRDSFIFAFKKKYGQTPQQYLRLKKNDDNII